MNDLVSIIMPSYNTAQYISESIDSVINQSYTNWELIIVDDCSSDNTDEVIKPYLSDKRIRYLKNEKNSGAAVSRNYALREAKGKWIAFLDSDDIWEAEKLSMQLDFMKKNNYVFTYTDYRIKLNGEWMPYIVTSPDKVNMHKLYNYCYFSTITVIYDREAVGLIQIADLKKHNDYAMWFEVMKKAKIAHRYPKCLSYYIKHGNSVSSGSKFNLIKHHYILFRKGLNKGRFLSAVLTANNVFHGVIKKLKYKETISKRGN